MKLSGTLTSPSVRKVRLLLREKGSMSSSSGPPPAPRARAQSSPAPSLDPFGKVPVRARARDDGQVMFDSSLIVESLDTLAGPPLLPAADEIRSSAALASLRQRSYRGGQRAPARAAPPGAVTVRRTDRARARALAWANAQPRGRAYLLEERSRLADHALGVALEFLDCRSRTPGARTPPAPGALACRHEQARVARPESQPSSMEKALQARF